MLASWAHHEKRLELRTPEIAELSAHLDAATARLLDLIREFDGRGRRVGGRPGKRYQVGFTSMPKSWRTPTIPASPSPRTARAFPRERPRAWRATPAGW